MALNPKRRLLLRAGSIVLAPLAVHAQDRYPSRPVRFIVPFAPGGGSDFTARQVAFKLTELRRYDVRVENKPGAGGSFGAEQALREPPDGYTLLVISGSYAANAVLNKPVFDPVAAIHPIVQFTREPLALAVPPRSPYRTLDELVRKARGSPTAVRYGSPGTGSFLHLSTEYLALLSDVKFNHIPYRGTSAALADLTDGTLDFMLGGVTSVAPLAKAGKVRLLAIGGARRLAQMSDVPTFVEAGLAGFNLHLWHGLVAPKGVSGDVVAQLNADVNAVLRDPGFVSRLAADGVMLVGGAPEQFGQVIRDDMERWRRIVQQKKIKAE